MDYKKGHRSRLLEQLKNHPESLQDYEILEALLFFVIPQKDTKPLAKNLLEEYKTLNGVLKNAKDLIKIEGVGERTTSLFSLVNNLFLRIQKEEIKNCFYEVESPKSVVNYLKNKIGFIKYESFGVIYLDAERKIIDTQELFKGTVDKVVVHKRELIEAILSKGSASVVLYHNHPNFEKLYASDADIELTKKIIEALSIIDVELLDHIIVSYNDFTSMKSEGII